MLSVNRYRVRHRAQAGSASAQVLERLLKRPDDWLGVNLVILAAASVFASQASTLIAQRSQLHFALSLTGIALTIIMIVFGELVPKIFAATHSEAVALSCAQIYRALVLIARPVLWLTSRAAYAVLRLFGVVRGVAQSALTAGFKVVALMGDHGGGQDEMALAAQQLDAQERAAHVRRWAYFTSRTYKHVDLV